MADDDVIRGQTREWQIEEAIGDPSGFGRVYRVRSGDKTAAAKFVPKAPGAERELLFEELNDVRNVVPIIDRAETDDAWVLVMPLAERSLRHLISEREGRLELSEALR